jgi:hypothetical protein
MDYADPWDEIARLERQMEVELLMQLERTLVHEAERLPVAERVPADRTRLDPRR